jgi:ribonuclease Z
MSGRTEALTIIAPQGIKEMVTAVAAASDLLLPYDVNFIAVEDMEGWASADFTVCKIALSHRVPSYAYVFTEKPLAHKLDVELLNKLGVPKGPLWGKLQQGQAVTLEDHTRVNPEDCYLKEGKPRKAIICGDNDNPELLKDFALDVSLIVHEATYTQDIAEKVGKGPQHSCAKIVAKFAERKKVPNVILTHFSARYQDDTEKSPSIADIEKEARSYYSGQLYLANDLDVFEVSKNSVVVKTEFISVINNNV